MRRNPGVPRGGEMISDITTCGLAGLRGDGEGERRREGREESRLLVDKVSNHIGVDSKYLG